MTHPAPQQAGKHVDWASHIFGPPSPQTVAKKRAPYADGQPCPVCGQLVFEVENLDGSIDFLSLCGWRREKSPAPEPKIRRVRLTGEDLEATDERICPKCQRIHFVRPNSPYMKCQRCRSAMHEGVKLNGDIIKAGIDKLGVTRTAFAARIGMSYAMLNNVIKGNTGVRNEGWIKGICKVLGVEREDIEKRKKREE